MKKPLTLTQKDFRKNALTLFKKLDGDETLQKKFIENPVDVVSERIYKKKAKKSVKLSPANKLIFSILANDKIQQFLHEYARTNEKKEHNHDEFISQFVKKIVELKEFNIVTSLVADSLGGIRMSDKGTVAKQYSFSVTEVNSSGAAVYNKSYTVTENKTKGFGLDDIGDRIIQASVLRQLSEQIIRHAKELNIQGELTQPGF